MPLTPSSDAIYSRPSCFPGSEDPPSALSPQMLFDRLDVLTFFLSMSVALQVPRVRSPWSDPSRPFFPLKRKTFSFPLQPIGCVFFRLVAFFASPTPPIFSLDGPDAARRTPLSLHVAVHRPGLMSFWGSPRHAFFLFTIPPTPLFSRLTIARPAFSLLKVFSIAGYRSSCLLRFTLFFPSPPEAHRTSPVYAFSFSFRNRRFSISFWPRFFPLPVCSLFVRPVSPPTISYFLRRRAPIPLAVRGQIFLPDQRLPRPGGAIFPPPHVRSNRLFFLCGSILPKVFFFPSSATGLAIAIQDRIFSEYAPFFLSFHIGVYSRFFPFRVRAKGHGFALPIPGRAPVQRHRSFLAAVTIALLPLHRPIEGDPFSFSHSMAPTSFSVTIRVPPPLFFCGPYLPQSNSFGTFRLPPLLHSCSFLFSLAYPGAWARPFPPPNFRIIKKLTEAFSF